MARALGRAVLSPCFRLYGSEFNHALKDPKTWTSTTSCEMTCGMVEYDGVS